MPDPTDWTSRTSRTGARVLAPPQDAGPNVVPVAPEELERRIRNLATCLAPAHLLALARDLEGIAWRALSFDPPPDDDPEAVRGGDGAA